MLCVLSLWVGPTPGRRAAVVGGLGAALLPRRASARAAGSQDVGEAVLLIKQSAVTLKQLQADWGQYAIIDSEGRAGNIDAARRVLGGVARQNELGLKANLAGAFVAVRRAALATPDAWGDALDVESFVETGERVTQALGEADDAFYGAVFASKGSTQIEGIYRTAKRKVDASVRDVDAMIALLRDAAIPGA